jgi:hypothetical protein
MVPESSLEISSVSLFCQLFFVHAVVGSFSVGFDYADACLWHICSSQIGLGDSGYQTDEEVSVGYDSHGDGEQQELVDGDGKRFCCLFLVRLVQLPVYYRTVINCDEGI